MNHAEATPPRIPQTVTDLVGHLHPILRPTSIITPHKSPCQQPHRLAGVLIPVIQNDGGSPESGALALLFVQRATGLPQHSGEVGFPGGVFKTSIDMSIEDTVLRETEEEIGITPDHVQVLGALDPLFSISNFCIIPLLAAVSPPYAFSPDHHEIQEAFTVPLSFLLAPTNHQLIRRVIGNQEHQLHLFKYQRFTIWGVTGELVYRILHQLDPTAFPPIVSQP